MHRDTQAPYLPPCAGKADDGDAEGSTLACQLGIGEKDAYIAARDAEVSLRADPGFDSATAHRP